MPRGGADDDDACKSSPAAVELYARASLELLTRNADFQGIDSLRTLRIVNGGSVTFMPRDCLRGFSRSTLVLVDHDVVDPVETA